MAWASSPTTVTPRPSGRRASTKSACRALTSWYSSTRTWSNSRPARRPPTRTRRAPGQQQQVVEVEQLLRPLARGVRRRTRPGCRRRRRCTTGTTRSTTSAGAAWRVGHPAEMAASVSLRGNRRPCARRRARGRGGRDPISSTASPCVEHAEARVEPDAGDRGRAATGGRRRGTCRPTPGRPGAGSARRPARLSISAAARREKVSRQIRSGSAPPSSQDRATRAASVAVLPVPAPARTSSGPSPCCTARRCSELRSVSVSGRLANIRS